VLRQLVDGLAARPEVAGAAVVSADGLIIEHALVGSLDRDAIAALATTLARHAAELGAAAGRGDLGFAAFDFHAGPAVLTPLDGGSSLLLLGRPDADLGELLYLLRFHRQRLAALL
jgi:predicted regulator of Ras-like GTPase activity (Roadblock/LC7/MglB family)